MILTEVCVSLITWVGFTTHTEEIVKITNSIFIAQFFNTGILIVLVNANLSDNFTFLGTILHGPFTDYSPMWYKVCGYYIVQTMLVNAFMTPIN